MPEVYNWQLGRKMYYPYEETHPNWQFTFVFNTNRCINCQTCTMAHKSTWTFSKGQEYMWWNNVETKPYGGYPQFWDWKILRLLNEAAPGKSVWNARTQSDKSIYGVYEGPTIFEAANREMRARGNQAIGYVPTDQEWRFPNMYQDTATGREDLPTKEGHHGADDGAGAELNEHKVWFFYIQRLCNHCTYPGCIAACPRKAIYKREQDGIVLIDQSRCRGYKKCVEQCPYKRPMFRGTTRISEKCIACYPRIEGLDPLTEGEPMETRCMAACVGKIRLQGLVEIDKATGLWKHDPKNPQYYMIKVRKVALPLYPQLGTEPNSYYVPPRHAPRPYLRQMFGPGVDHAIDQYLVPDRELLAVHQLWRTTQKIIFKFEIEQGPKIYETNIHGKKFEMFNDTVIGFSKSGKEAVRVPVDEPLVIRNQTDPKHDNVKIHWNSF